MVKTPWSAVVGLRSHPGTGQQERAHGMAYFQPKPGFHFPTSSEFTSCRCTGITSWPAGRSSQMTSDCCTGHCTCKKQRRPRRGRGGCYQHPVAAEGTCSVVSPVPGDASVPSAPSAMPAQVSHLWVPDSSTSHLPPT